MLRQRLLAAVIVRGERAVQSFGYQKWLPIGKVTCLVENLDNWGVDGIVVLCTDRGLNGPNLKLIRSLSALNLSTPITYGGGVHNAEQARLVIQEGAERLVLDRILSDAPQELPAIAAAVGRQALIAALPLRLRNKDCLEHWQYWCKKSHSLNEWLSGSNWPEYVSEILTIDVKAEGSREGPNPKFITSLNHLGLPILAFGGLSQASQVKVVLELPGVAAAVIGNALNYQENSIHMLKKQLTGLPLRPHPSEKHV